MMQAYIAPFPLSMASAWMGVFLSGLWTRQESDVLKKSCS